MRTIDWDDGAVVIIDQRVLPHETRLLHLREVAELVTAIRSLAVRGAMALGVAGAFGVALAVVRAEETGEDPAEMAASAAVALEASRPTAVNLSRGVRRVLSQVPGGPAAVVHAALAVRDEDILTNRAIGERGAELLAGQDRLLTHCNAGALAGVEYGSALSIIRRLHETTGIAEVLVSETRPLLQGARLTAWELSGLGVPFRIIVDSAAAGLLSRGAAGAVVVGADRIAANGDVANKVGTLSHALAARHAQVPFVVAAPESTIDYETAAGAGISLEERDPEEVLRCGDWRTAPEGSAAYNPAFDVTPACLVTAIVTERRVIRPAEGERPDDPEVPPVVAVRGVSG